MGEVNSKNEKVYVGIRGWLLLIFYGLIISFVNNLFTAFQFSDMKDHLLSVPFHFIDSSDERSFQLLIYFESFVNYLLSFAIACTLFFMLNRSKLFPLIMIVLLILFLLINVVITIWTLRIASELASWLDFIPTMLIVSVLIPCLVKSKRVKNTFL